jgi:hypothetical protein
MIEVLTTETPAHLRHEYSTPVKHIVGYGRLLVEEAVERHLDRFIPAFQQIRQGGVELLALIENTPDQWLDPNADSEGEAFRVSLHAVALEILRTLKALAEYPECAHRQTLTDFDAISGAIDHLLELTGLQREDEQVYYSGGAPLYGAEAGIATAV